MVSVTNSRSNNSILFLTTLGVYLGLVLVGATPVLGHAATTRNFELLDEIEFKDDLDRKPDEETSLDEFSTCLEDLFKIASEWSVANAPDGSLDELLSFNSFVSVKPNGSAKHTYLSGLRKGPLIGLGKNRKPLQRLYDAFLPREADWHEQLFVQFGFGLGDISLEASILRSDPSAAAAAADSYSKALARRLAAETVAVRLSILQSMDVTAEGDRLIIVTRLPRAALIPLLANDAK